MTVWRSAGVQFCPKSNAPASAACRGSSEGGTGRESTYVNMKLCSLCLTTLETGAALQLRVICKPWKIRTSLTNYMLHKKANGRRENGHSP